MIVDRTNNSADKVVDYAYQYYDANGKNNNRIRQITDNIETAYSTTYSYDNYNRLTNATANAFSRNYQHDPFGNITNFSGLTLNYQTNASGAPATNRIDTDSQNFSYTYDSAGNMTVGAGQSYGYDGANRLKTASGGTSSYGYDGDGKRVKKTENGATTYYVYSSKLGQSVMEVTANSVQRAYVYSGSKLVAMQATDGQFYWLHTNHLGNSRAMTDASGNLTYKGQFDPYGATLTEWSGSGNTNLNSKKFTGYERDSATGLDYANARMYNSSRGRFMTSDPVGLGCGNKKPEPLAGASMQEALSLNRFTYVKADPVNFVDKTGYKAQNIDEMPISCSAALSFEECQVLGDVLANNPDHSLSTQTSNVYYQSKPDCRTQNCARCAAGCSALLLGCFTVCAYIPFPPYVAVCLLSCSIAYASCIVRCTDRWPNP